MPEAKFVERPSSRDSSEISEIKSLLMQTLENGKAAEITQKANRTRAVAGNLGMWARAQGLKFRSRRMGPDTLLIWLEKADEETEPSGEVSSGAAGVSAETARAS
jgi:hypothetical protein